MIGEKQSLNRREFLKLVGKTLGALALMPLLSGDSDAQARESLASGWKEWEGDPDVIHLIGERNVLTDLKEKDFAGIEVGDGSLAVRFHYRGEKYQYSMVTFGEMGDVEPNWTQTNGFFVTGTEKESGLKVASSNENKAFIPMVENGDLLSAAVEANRRLVKFGVIPSLDSLASDFDLSWSLIGEEGTAIRGYDINGKAKTQDVFIGGYFRLMEEGEGRFSQGYFTNCLDIVRLISRDNEGNVEENFAVFSGVLDGEGDMPGFTWSEETGVSKPASPEWIKGMFPIGSAATVNLITEIQLPASIGIVPAAEVHPHWVFIDKVLNSHKGLPAVFSFGQVGQR